MIRLLLLEWLTARQIGNLTKTFQQKVERATRQVLDAATRGRGVSSGSAASGVSTYTGRRTVAAALPEVMQAFNDFAQMRLIQWRKTAAGAKSLTSQGKYLVFAHYAASFSVAVQLERRTFSARLREGLEQREPRYDGCVEQITYQYQCCFELIGQPAGGTVLSFVTTETIDPYGHCRRNLRQHYRAPALPNGFGNVGAEFLDRVDPQNRGTV